MSVPRSPIASAERKTTRCCIEHERVDAEFQAVVVRLARHVHRSLDGRAVWAALRLKECWRHRLATPKAFRYHALGLHPAPNSQENVLSLYLNFNDNKSGAQLASNTGWGDVGRWLETVPEATCPDLHCLFQDGLAYHLQPLAAQIRLALQTVPASESVTEVLTNLVDILQAAPKRAYKVWVSNGMS